MNSKCDGGEMSCDSKGSNEINKRTGAEKDKMMLFEDVDMIEGFLLSVCLEGSISETSPERSAYICLFLPLSVSLTPSVGHIPALRSAVQKCP